MMNTNNALLQLSEVAARIKELRDIMGWTVAEMAEKTDVTVEKYELYESGKADIPLPLYINALWSLVLK